MFSVTRFHDELHGATESERERRRSIKDGKSFSIFSLEHFALNYLIIYYAAEGGGWRERGLCWLFLAELITESSHSLCRLLPPV